MIRTSVLLVSILLSVRSFAATHTWTGAASDKISDALNWTGGSPVGDGAAVLVFPRGAARFAVVNDVSGLNFSSIELATSAYTLTGASLATNGGTIRAQVETTIGCNLAITGQVSAERINFTGAISGSGTLVVSDSEITLSGSASNTYSGGTILKQAGVWLLKTSGAIAIPGDVQATSAYMMADETGQIGDTAKLVDTTAKSLLALAADETVGGVAGFRVAPRTSQQQNVRLTATTVGPTGVDIQTDLELRSAIVSLSPGAALKVAGMVSMPATGLTVTGDGVVTFKTSDAVPLRIDGPAANVEAPRAAVTLAAGSYSGSAGSLVATGGTVRSLRSRGDVRLHAAVTVEFNVSLNGVLDLGGAKVQWPSWPDRPTDPMVVISNESSHPVVGTFAGVVENVPTTNGFIVSYRGGDGNDVALDKWHPNDGKSNATLTLSQQPNPAWVGEPVTLRAVVSGPGPLPTGTVTFLRSSSLSETELGTAPLVNGASTLTHTYDTHEPLERIMLRYSGDAAHFPAASPETNLSLKLRQVEISSMTPSTAVAGTGVVDVVIRGSYFPSAPDVYINDTAVPASAISSSEIRFSFDLHRFRPAIHLPVKVGGPNRLLSAPVYFKVTLPPPDSNEPLTFDDGGVIARVSPGAVSAWVTARCPAPWAETDADRDGFVTIPWDFPVSDVWAVVDVPTGRWSLRSSYNAAAPLLRAFAPHTFVRDKTGNVSNLVLRLPRESQDGAIAASSWWRLLWVRPGLGAWTTAKIRDGVNDTDGAYNDLAFVSASSFHALARSGAGERPAGFTAGDVLIMMPDRLSNAGNVVFAATLDDELVDGAAGVLQFASPDVTAQEREGVAKALVMRTDGGEGPASVSYETVPTTAQPGLSYLHTQSILVFGPGETLKYVQIPLIDDHVARGHVGFNIVLSNPIPGTLGRQATSAVLIMDDDRGTDDGPRPEASLVAINATVPEGNDGVAAAELEIRLSAASTAPVNVFYVTANHTATAGADYQSVVGEVSFARGETVKRIVIPVFGDVVDEQDEMFVVTLTGATNATVFPSVAAITILDDDATPPARRRSVRH